MDWAAILMITWLIVLTSIGVIFGGKGWFKNFLN